MQTELYTHTQIAFDTQLSSNIVSGKALFTQKAYSTVLEACINDLIQFPICAAVCNTLSVTSQAMLSKAPIAFSLAERDALEYIKQGVEVTFGKQSSSLKCKSYIHKIVAKQVASVCERIEIDPSHINSERLKATLLLFLSYKASQQLEQLIQSV